MRWYVLRSKPNREETLWLEVGARGFEVFYPQLRVQPVNPRSRKMRPYFPGYMFVKVKLEEVGESAFMWLPHSQGLVSFGGQPAEVPDGLLQAIRKRVDEINASGGEQLVGLEKGEPVVIRGGPFDGYRAIFDARVSGNERVRVFLKLLKVQQRLELPASQIEPEKRS
jgi:transcription antitermination factor NusG